MSDASRPSALHLLHRAGQCADEVFASQIAESEMTPRQFAVLKAIADSAEPSQTTLVQATGIDRSTLTDIMRRLVKRGLVARKRTRHDARMYAVRLTERGDAALKQAQPAAQTTEQRLLSALQPKEREVFLGTLAKIVNVTGDAERGG